MNLIEYLSLKIEVFAVFFSSIITAVFPFLSYYLDNHPEKIMIIIGFIKFKRIFGSTWNAYLINI